MHYKDQRRHVRRRLVILFMVSVLPLFADDDVVVVPQPDNTSNDNNNNNEYTSSILSPPLHHQQLELEEEEVNYRRYYRIYQHDGNHHPPQQQQKWVEQVWLPKQLIFNGTSSTSDIIPYYPFESSLLLAEMDSIDSTTLTTATTTKHHDGSNQQPPPQQQELELEQRRLENQTTTTTKHKQQQEKEQGTLATGTTDPITNDNVATTTTPLVSKVTTTITQTPPNSIKHVEVDYASKSAGAVILDSSPNFQGVSNLLQQDRDKYAIVPCSSSNSDATTTTTTMTEPKYVVIGLSEDILVKQFAIANYERYSSHMKEIRLYGSVSIHAIREPNNQNWIHLGNFIAQWNTNHHSHDKQIFTISEPTWVRYVKVQFISHYGDEYYCTISQISVHGSTVLQGFHEQWNEENHDNTATTTATTDVVVVNDDDEEVATTDISSTGTTASTTVQSNVHSDDVASTVDHVKHKKGQKDKIDRMVERNTHFDHIAGNVTPTSSERKSSEQEGGTTSTTRSVTTNHDRYNFSRITGCRSSSNFEETLSLFTSHNKSMNMGSDSTTSSTISRPSRSSTSFTNLCTTTSKTVIVPNKRSIHRIQVRHRPRTSTTTASGTNVLLSSRTNMAAPTHRPFSKLSLGLERVTDFVRNAIEGFHGSSNKMMMTNHLIQQPNEQVVSSSNEEKNDVLVNSNDIHESVVTESDVVGSSSENGAASDSNDDKDYIKGSNALMMAQLLKRFPSAECLEKLHFVEFKSSNNHHIKTTSSSKPRNDSNNNNHGGNGGGGSSSSGHSVTSMEPIFKKLTDEIKSLQSNMALHDQFTKESMSCYQRVILDMLLEMESDRRSYDMRMTKLEEEIHLTTFLMASRRFVLRTFTSIWIYCRTLTHLLADRVTSVISLVSVLLLAASTFMFMYVITVVRRRYRLTMFATKQQNNEINIVTNNTTISFPYATNHTTSEDDDDSSAELIPLSPNEQHMVPKKEEVIPEQ